MFFLTESCGFCDSCLCCGPALLCPLQIGLGLREGSRSFLNAGRELLVLALGSIDGFLKCALAVFTVAHKFVEQSLFLLSISLDLFVHVLQHRHHTTNRVRVESRASTYSKGLCRTCKSQQNEATERSHGARFEKSSITGRICVSWL